MRGLLGFWSAYIGIQFNPQRGRECEVLKSGSLSAEVLIGGGGGGGGIVWEICTLWIGCRWMSF